MVKVKSTLQKNVLTFYREYLKFANSKPEVSPNFNSLLQPLKSNLRIAARTLMEKHKDIPRTNFNYIEFVLRTEANKLQTLKMSSIDSIKIK